MHVTKEFKWKHKGNIVNCVIQSIADAPTLTSFLAIHIGDGICQICLLKTFWVKIFARGTLLLFRCVSIHGKMCDLLRYCGKKCV